MKKTALIAGASGAVGLELTKQLCKNNSYQKIIAISRKNLGFKHEKLQNEIVNFDNINSLELKDIDEVYCALGTTIKDAKTKENFIKVDVDYPFALAKWAKQKYVKSFILISSKGADENSKNFYLNQKGRVQRLISELNFQSLSIIQPPLIEAKREKFRFGETLLVKFFKLFPKKWFKFYPMSAENIAQNVIKIVAKNEFGIKIYELNA